jgi:secreted trypsin-like serine protease
MVRKILFVSTVAVLALVLQAPGAQAITYGEPDGNDHPNVGALIVDYAGDDEGPNHICSGTLIDEDVFLTAAHCTFDIVPADQVYVSFATDVDPLPRRLLSGEAVSNPNFTWKQSDTGDLAVVLLDREVGLTPARLPEVGLFDRMKAAGTLNQSTRFTAVGYGVHEPTKGGGPPTFPYDGMRWKAVSTFNSLEKAWLTLSQNDNTSEGGTCYGDSGGPNFLGAEATETNIIAGVTVTGDAMCRSTNKIYRLDTAAAHAFIQPFLD